MKKDLLKSLENAAQNSVAAFAVGAMCGMVVSLFLFPVAKGISICSNNGNHNGNENQMSSTKADKKSPRACKKTKKRGNRNE